MGCNVTTNAAQLNDSSDLLHLLSDLVPPSGFWDLVDIDAQGAEDGMLTEASLEAFAHLVRRFHISTHSRSIHWNLLARFRAAGWLVPIEYVPLSVGHVSRLGPFPALDGHFTAFPPRGVPTHDGEALKDFLLI